MGSINSTLRQDVWRAAYEGLTGIPAPERRQLADNIANGFEKLRFSTSKSAGVAPEVKLAIEADLEKGGMSFAKIKDRHGVGMSTVQRVASEMKARGLTVRTAGQTNVGAAIPA